MSHELRTPLTTMRTAIDVALAKPTRTPEQLETMAEKVRRSIDKAERTIEALLALAASNRGVGPEEPLDLATAAEDALDVLDGMVHAESLRVEADLAEAEVAGSRVLLERMVGNLVENAVRHNVTGGWVRLRTGSVGERAFLEVANSGPIVPRGRGRRPVSTLPTGRGSNVVRGRRARAVDRALGQPSALRHSRRPPRHRRRARDHHDDAVP